MVAVVVTDMVTVIVVIVIAVSGWLVYVLSCCSHNSQNYLCIRFGLEQTEKRKTRFCDVRKSLCNRLAIGCSSFKQHNYGAWILPPPRQRAVTSHTLDQEFF